MAKRNDCRQGLGYTIRHKEESARVARMRERCAKSAAADRERERLELERISALLRPAREDAGR